MVDPEFVFFVNINFQCLQPWFQGSARVVFFFHVFSTSYQWSNGVITSISTVISSVIRVFFVFKQNHTTHTTPNTQ